MVCAILACAFLLSRAAGAAEAGTTVPPAGTVFVAAAIPVAAKANAAAALPAAANLAVDGAAARDERIPVLLFFNRDGCPYCERALREYLGPMQRDPAYTGHVLFRQIETDKATRLVDFGGRATTHSEFASRYKIRLTPTIWFVDGNGNRLADPIIGLPTVDFFGFYLDQAINDSRAKLQR